MRLFFKLLSESVLLSLNAMRANVLRTVLSLLGITFGIFAIIGVFTMIDSMERNIKDSIASLGENVVFVQKWPWTFGSDYPWWKYINRPTPTLEELEQINARCESADATAYVIETNKTVEYKNTSMEGVQIVCASHDYDRVRNFELTAGRYFTEAESKSGNPVCIIGSTVALALFGYSNPLDKSVKTAGRKLKVVGVFKQEGESMIGNSTDEMLLAPINFARTIVNVRSRGLEPRIMVKAKPGVSNEQLKDELTGLMRSLRRINPKEDSSFALNETSMLSQGLEGFFSAINFAGFIIGIFSILVGGFGIANIMFVSVKERTPVIGIQKALGAKSWFILVQFLSEAVSLCMIGGLIGLVIIFLLTLIVQGAFDVNMYLGVGNIIFGIVLSVSIGLISGIVPAWRASKLDPVEAMRS